MTRRREVTGDLAEPLQNLPRSEESPVLQPHIVDQETKKSARSQKAQLIRSIFQGNN